MANRRPQLGGGGGRRMDFRNDQRKNFGRSGMSPWQGGGPGGSGLPNLLPLGGGSTEATLALASNILNLLQPRQNPVPSLLDMPIRRDFVPNMGRFDRGFPPQRGMGNHGNFRRTGHYNHVGERINNNRKQFKPNDGQRQQNKSSPKKEADSKAKPVKESETEVRKEDAQEPENANEDGKKVPPKTRYDDVHPSQLKCHICHKTMWDGRSFENHLSGRAHAIMMQKTAESYALTADTMRQELKIREMKRTRKSGQQPHRDFYCAMCDMHAADGAVHRTTPGHRKLKKYLHPTCTSCHKEMPTRIELDEHRLTAEHLKNMQDKQEDVTKPKPEVMVISTLMMEQSFLREDRQRKRRDHKDKQSNAATEETGEDNNKLEDGIKPVDGGIKQEPGTEVEPVKKSTLDNDDTVLDYQIGDDLSHVTADMIPAYSTERGVGASFLQEFKCVQCLLCNKLLDNEETAQVHLRTWKHHQLFAKSLQPAPMAIKQEEPVPVKRSLDESDDGNWKRRRTDDGDREDRDGDQDMDQEGGDGGAAQDYNEGQDEELTADQVEEPRQEDLEDWDQSVDEILNDEQNSEQDIQDNGTDAGEPQPEPEEEPSVEPPAPPAPPGPALVDRPRSSPRRGRGRGRGWN